MRFGPFAEEIEGLGVRYAGACLDLGGAGQDLLHGLFDSGFGRRQVSFGVWWDGPTRVRWYGVVRRSIRSIKLCGQGWFDFVLGPDFSKYKE